MTTDYKFITEPNDSLKCLICQDVASATNPCQHGSCGRVFCKECLEKLGVDKPCPYCRMERPQYFEDNKSKREIKALLVKCENNDCVWQGTIGDLDMHVGTCRLTEVSCPNECKEGDDVRQIMRKDLNEHLQKQCPKRDYKCEYCGEKGTYANISQDHDKVCEKKIVSCKNEDCDVRMERMKIKNHLANDCEHTVISCKYVSIGCDVKLKRKYMRAHEQDDKAHLSKLIDNVVKWKDKLKKKMTKLQVNAEENTDKLQDLTLEVVILEDTPATFENTITRLQSSVGRLQGDLSKMQGHFFYLICLVALVVVFFGGFAFSNLPKENKQCLFQLEKQLENTFSLSEESAKVTVASFNKKSHATEVGVNATAHSLETNITKLEDDMVSTKIILAFLEEKSHTTEVGVNATAHSLETNITKLEDDMVSTKIILAFLEEKSHTTEVGVNATAHSLETNITKLEDDMKITLGFLKEKSHATEVGVNATAHYLEKNITKLEDDMADTKITLAFLEEKSHTTEVSVNDTIDKTQSLQDKVTIVEDEIASTKMTLASLKKKVHANVNVTEKKAQSLWDEVDRLRVDIATTNKSLASLEMKSKTYAIVTKLTNITSRIKYVQDVVLDMKHVIVHLLNHWNNDDHYTEVVDRLSLKDKVTKKEDKVTKKDDEVASIERESVISSNKRESMTFKVTEYQKKKDIDETFMSPSFYTSPNGYHMAMRVDANGNGRGKGSHVSVFAYILEGKYDNSLKWPFVGTITFQLLNQLEDKNHRSKRLSITPKINMTAGHNQRGYPDFIAHSELDRNQDSDVQYLKDDALFFRLTVEVADHKPWLDCTADAHAHNLKILDEQIKMSLRKRDAFVFSITEYLRKKSRAGSSIYSPPFYTSPRGYRVKIKVWFFKMKVAVNVLIIEGEYDNELIWPLTATFTIELLNQLEDVNHHNQKIVVKAERGKAERGNDRSIKTTRIEGLYSFISLSANPQYIEDDMLYFRVSSDTGYS